MKCQISGGQSVTVAASGPAAVTRDTVVLSVHPANPEYGRTP